MNLMEAYDATKRSKAARHLRTAAGWAHSDADYLSMEHKDIQTELLEFREHALRIARLLDATLPEK